MITIESFGRKKNVNNISVGGGGFANVATSNSELQTHYFWGQPYNGRQDVNGDITTDGNVSASNVYADNVQADALSAGTIDASYISGTTGVLTNINFNTAIGGNVHSQSAYTDYLNSDSAYTGYIEATSGKVTSISGQNLSYSAATANTLNSNDIICENLTVTKSAHFFELIIDKIKSAGGSLIMTSSDGFKTDKAERVMTDTIMFDVRRYDEYTERAWQNLATIGHTSTWTLLNTQYLLVSVGTKLKLIGTASDSGTLHEVILQITSKNGNNQVSCVTIKPSYVYKAYWKTSDGEKSIENMWKVNDQAICQTFNAATGTTYDTSNKYYWSLVTAVGTEAIDGEDYHYIALSEDTCDGTLLVEEGDEITQLGYRGTDDQARQSAIYIAAYNSIDTGVTAPLIAQYEGIDDFNLASHRKTWFAHNGNEVRGNLKITTASGDVDVNTAILQVTDEKITAAAEQILLDIKELLIDGDVTVNGLITNVSKHINQNDLTQSDAIVIDLIDNKNITIENIITNVTESLDNNQIVYLPYYDSMYDVPTKVIHSNPNVTAAEYGFNESGFTIQDSGITINVPKYEVEGTQIRITNSYVPTLNNWQNYEYIYQHASNEKTLYTQLLKSCVIVCADPRIFNYKNYVAANEVIFDTPYGVQTSATNVIEPSHSGAFLYKGIRARFLYLLPTQSVNLRSQIVNYADGRKVLNWNIENSDEFVPLTSAIGIEYGSHYEVRWDYDSHINGTTWQTVYTQTNDVILGHPAINADSLSSYDNAVYPVIKVTNNTIATNGLVPYVRGYNLLRDQL